MRVSGNITLEQEFHRIVRIIFFKRDKPREKFYKHKMFQH